MIQGHDTSCYSANCLSHIWSKKQWHILILDNQGSPSQSALFNVCPIISVKLLKHFEGGRKLAGIDCERCMGAMDDIGEARLDWNSYGQKWILIPSLYAVWTNVHTGMGRLSIEDETQCTQLCNVAIPVFIASATNIIDCKWAIGFENIETSSSQKINLNT